MRNKFIGTIFNTSSANFLATGINFLVSIYLAKVLGVSSRGEWAIIFTSINLLATFACFGLNQSLIFELSSDKNNSNVLTVALFIFVTNLIVVFLGILIFNEFFTISFLIPLENLRNSTLVFYLIWFGFLFANQLQISILSAYERFNIVNISNLFFYVFLLLSVAYLQYFQVSMWSRIETVLALYTILTVLHFGYNFYFAKKYFVLNFKFINFNLKFLNRSFSSFKIIFLKYLLFRADFWIVNFFLGTKILGYYSLSVYLVQIIGLFSSSISTVLLAYFAKMDDVTAKRGINLVVSIFFSGTIFITVLITPLFYFGILYFFGDEFYEASRISLILLLGMPFYSIIIILEAYNISRGNTERTFFPILLGLILSVICNVITIKYFDIWGVSVINVLTFVVIAIILMRRAETFSRNIFSFQIIKKFRQFNVLTKV